jgi:uncharacterized protein
MPDGAAIGSPPVELQGSTILVTGASGNVGSAIARALHARGASIKGAGRNVDALEELKRELGERVEALPGSLATGEDAHQLAERAGPVDGLVAVAGISPIGPLAEHTREEIDNTLDLNVRTGIHLARAVLPGMLERGRGHLVFISSVSGRAFSRGRSLYSSTSYALRGFAGCLRLDLEKTGVGVTTVYPGPIETPGDTELPGFKLDIPPARVAKAVVRGIEQDKGEIVVAPLVLRGALRLTAVAPRLGPPSPKDQTQEDMK